MRSIKRWHVSVVALLSVLSLAICGWAGASTTQTAHASAAVSGLAQAKAYLAKAESAPTQILQTTPLPKAPPKHGLLYNMVDNNPQDIVIAADMKKAVLAIGWNYKQTVVNPDDPSQVQEALMNGLTEHATVTVEAGLPVSVIGQSVMSAYKKAKVPMVVSGVTPLTTSRWVRGPVQGHGNGVVTGKMLAAWFVVTSHADGEALIEDVPAYTGLEVLRNTFVSQTKAWCPKCSVSEVNFTTAQVDAGSVVSGIVAQLRDNPSIKYLISDQGAFISGINSALSAAGLSGIQIAGNAFSAENAAAIRAGTQQAWTGLDDNYYALCNIDAALRGVVGAPNSDKCDVQLKRLFTKKTIGNLSTNWQALPNENQEFYKLWRVTVK